MNSISGKPSSGRGTFTVLLNSLLMGTNLQNVENAGICQTQLVWLFCLSVMTAQICVIWCML